MLLNVHGGEMAYSGRGQSGKGTVDRRQNNESVKTMSVAPLLNEQLGATSKQKTSNLLSPAPPPSTHDLFWAKVRVQLHLPPLRSLDLAWNPAGFFYTRGSLTSNCSGMIACTGGMSECSFECEYVPWVNGQWIEGTGSVQHRLKTAELFSVTMRRVHTHTHTVLSYYEARAHTHTHTVLSYYEARARTHTHTMIRMWEREREQTGIKRVA